MFLRSLFAELPRLTAHSQPVFADISTQCFQNQPSAVASDGNVLICDAYFPFGKLYDK